MSKDGVQFNLSKNRVSKSAEFFRDKDSWSVNPEYERAPPGFTKAGLDLNSRITESTYSVRLSQLPQALHQNTMDRRLNPAKVPSIKYTPPSETEALSVQYPKILTQGQSVLPSKRPSIPFPNPSVADFPKKNPTIGNPQRRHQPLSRLSIPVNPTILTPEGRLPPVMGRVQAGSYGVRPAISSRSHDPETSLVSKTPLKSGERWMDKLMTLDIPKEPVSHLVQYNRAHHTKKRTMGNSENLIIAALSNLATNQLQTHHIYICEFYTSFVCTYLPLGNLIYVVLRDVTCNNEMSCKADHISESSNMPCTMVETGTNIPENADLAYVMYNKSSFQFVTTNRSEGVSSNTISTSTGNDQFMYAPALFYSQVFRSMSIMEKVKENLNWLFLYLIRLCTDNFLSKAYSDRLKSIRKQVANENKVNWKEVEEISRSISKP